MSHISVYKHLGINGPSFGCPALVDQTAAANDSSKGVDQKLFFLLKSFFYQSCLDFTASRNPMHMAVFI